jgi:hypothetical protein
MQSVPIITKVVSSNLVHSKVYSIQHYVIKYIHIKFFKDYFREKLIDCIQNLRKGKVFGSLGLWLRLLCLMPLSAIFQLCCGCQFYWWRKATPRCLKLECFVLYRAHLAWVGFKLCCLAILLYCEFYTLLWTRFELTTLVMIGTDCICRCKSNYLYHATTTAPHFFR